MDLQLALHAAAPKVQAFYQFYKDERFDLDLSFDTEEMEGGESKKDGKSEGCESWVDWYGERVCDVDTLARLAGHETINASNQTSSNAYVLIK